MREEKSGQFAPKGADCFCWERNKKWGIINKLAKREALIANRFSLRFALRDWRHAKLLDTLLIFILNRFIFRISEFIRRWYLYGARFYAHKVVSILEQLDKTFALKITWRHFGEPLYQDRTIVGYVLGFIFRLIRLLLGASIYGIIILIAVLIFAAWALAPIFIIFKIIGYDFSEKLDIAQLNKF